MKYYAVTEDPNELMHYGILGMKWGRRRTPDQLGHPRHTGSRKRSPAYKKAQSKLGKLMKSGIKKAQANWKEYNSPEAKEKRFMNKAMQQARTGTLKYGKLTDDQIKRVKERLLLERDARSLGSTENARYIRRLGTAISEGIVTGIGRGTASYIDERFKGRGKTTAEIKADKRKLKYNNREDIQAMNAENRARNEHFYKREDERLDREDKKLDERRERMERNKAKAKAQVKMRAGYIAQDAALALKNRRKGVRKTRKGATRSYNSNSYYTSGYLN